MSSKKLADGTIVTRTSRVQKPGWPCPRCGGSGHNNDGFASWSGGEDFVETKYRAPSDCHLCEGSGRVECKAIPK